MPSKSNFKSHWEIGTSLTSVAAKLCESDEFNPGENLERPDIAKQCCQCRRPLQGCIMTSRSNPRGFLSSWLGRLYIVAVAIGSLAFAVWLFTFIGNGGYNWRIGVTVTEARFSAPDRLSLRVNADCTKNSEVSRLVETDVDVQVEVVADATPFLRGVECGGGVAVQLQEPLGDRDVIDTRTGRVVRDASSHTKVSVVEAYLRAPDILFLYASTCDESPEVSHLMETDVDVQVEVVADSPLSTGWTRLPKSRLDTPSRAIGRSRCR